MENDLKRQRGRPRAFSPRTEQNTIQSLDRALMITLQPAHGRHQRIHGLALALVEIQRHIQLVSDTGHGCFPRKQDVFQVRLALAHIVLELCNIEGMQRVVLGIERQENVQLRDFPTLQHVVQFVYDNRPDLEPKDAPAGRLHVRWPSGPRWGLMLAFAGLFSHEAVQEIVSTIATVVEED